MANDGVSQHVTNSYFVFAIENFNVFRFFLFELNISYFYKRVIFKASAKGRKKEVEEKRGEEKFMLRAD